MIVQITDEEIGMKELDVPNDESGFYKSIAEYISELPFPNKITVVPVKAPAKLIQYTTEERGGTCNIQEESNNIIFKTMGSYPKVTLTYADYVSAEVKAKLEKGINVSSNLSRGSYKKYELEQEGEKIKASWGPMGGFGKQSSCMYPRSMYWIKYYEKVKKGYVINTEAYAEDEDKKEVVLPRVVLPTTPATKRNTLADRLYKLLTFSATTLIKRTVRSLHVTQGMINESKKFLNQMYQTENLDEFNQILLKLCMVSPRKVLDMKSLMAKSNEDISKVLQREEDLVQAMEGLLLNQQKTDLSQNSNKEEIIEDQFEKIGITISQPDNKDTELVLKMLPSDLQAKVAQVYKVYCKEHDDRFKEYVNKNSINNTKFLWHGSRNENWLSIIKMGLLLKPNAKITGKMFGNGIYFAPKAKKSWGYTSGGYWTREAVQHFAMMGVYETAYGNPYHPTRNESWSFTQSFLKGKKKNCVHAEGGTCGLQNDEIIFYDEAAMCLRYVVEFA